ncbi:MAG TPA: AEC family transporter, partial [Sedimentibacter sp.]|nr:AEC family transporter [Sedimentibacter sp.]
FLRRINIFDEDFLRKLNKITYCVLLPVLLFNNIYTSKVSGEIDLEFIIFFVILALAVIGILLIVIPKYEKDNRNRGVLIQGLFRGQFVFFGIPLMANISGDEGLVVLSTLIAIIVPIYNFLAVIILDLFTDERHNYKATIISILTNPLVIGSLLGIAASVLQIKLPSALNKTIADISKTVTPISLMILGGVIEINNIWKNRKKLILIAAVKLFIIPSFAALITIFFGYRGIELGAVLSMIAPPTAVASYTLAQQHDCNDELAGQIVFFTTLISPFSIFLFIFVFKTFGLF